jgi:ribonuclease P protein component
MRGATLLLNLMSNPRLTVTRVGFVVSNKVSKRATVRNQLKRRLREAVRPLLPDLLPGFQAILSASTPSLGRNFRELSDDVRDLFRRSKMLKRSS